MGSGLHRRSPGPQPQPESLAQGLPVSCELKGTGGLFRRRRKSSETRFVCDAASALCHALALSGKVLSLFIYLSLHFVSLSLSLSHTHNFAHMHGPVTVFADVERWRKIEQQGDRTLPERATISLSISFLALSDRIRPSHY